MQKNEKSLPDHRRIFFRRNTGGFLLGFMGTIKNFTGLQKVTGRSRSDRTKNPEQKKTDRVTTQMADVVANEYNGGIKSSGKQHGSNPGRNKRRPEDCHHTLYQRYPVHTDILYIEPIYADSHVVPSLTRETDCKRTLPGYVTWPYPKTHYALAFYHYDP